MVRGELSSRQRQADVLLPLLLHSSLIHSSSLMLLIVSIDPIFERATIIEEITDHIKGQTIECDQPFCISCVWCHEAYLAHPLMLPLVLLLCCAPSVELHQYWVSSQAPTSQRWSRLIDAALSPSPCLLFAAGSLPCHPSRCMHAAAQGSRRRR